VAKDVVYQQHRAKSGVCCVAACSPEEYGGTGEEVCVENANSTKKGVGAVDVPWNQGVSPGGDIRSTPPSVLLLLTDIPATKRERRKFKT
jgi:hypothetical protein